MKAVKYLAAGLLLAAFATPSLASEAEVTLTIKDHRFKPAAITVPAGQAIALNVVNADASPEEFESNDFHVEKVIPGGKATVFHIGPLAAGSYGFFGDRHQDTALGNLFAE